MGQTREEMLRREGPATAGTTSTATGHASTGHPWVVGGVVGLLTAGVALGVAQLAAAFVGELASPVIAVGEASIDVAPSWLREFAIRTFGTNDKLALLIGIGVLLTLFAISMGVLALRRRWVGYAGLAAFGAIGLLAAVTQATADTLSPVPSMVGVAAGAWALRLLLQTTGSTARPAAAESPLAFDRRRFIVGGLALGGTAVAAGLGSQFVGRSSARAQASRASLRIPRPSDVGPISSGTDLHVHGLSPFYTSNSTFYRVDTAIIVPKVAAQDWGLRIHGMVDREIGMDFAGLIARRLVERDVTLTCVSNEIGGNLVGNARWIGALLKPILEEARIRPGATQLVSRSTDGFTIGTPTAVVMDGRDAMLAVAMNGEPLPLEHGFPVRMIVPGLYGYVSATKWVVDLELTTFEAYDAYWVQRGWAQQAPIKTMSRVDVPRSGDLVPAGPIGVAGVAWAQHRGIERVEVRVDEGPWEPAELAVEDTVDTWRQWRFAWEARPARHRLQVRAIDKTGYVQTGSLADPAPNGATGWHTIVVKVA
jgi:DMSO/TMAO reductase YedYZ molybdopterin-dependent catalytic subunit